jgi:hypothetical protein
MIDINPEGRYDNEKMAEKQGYEQPEKRDVMVDINPEGEHDEEKTVGKQPYKQQAETDPREHFVKGDGLEDAPEDTSKVVEKEIEKKNGTSTHWEDVEEERSSGTDIKSVLELKTEVSEEEAEEKFDDDDRGEDDGELFIKGDGFEDDSEDTAEEEMMKQVEVPKSWEGIKKELISGADITDDPGTKTGGVLKTKPDEDKKEGFEDTTEDTFEVDKDETDEENMVEQDEALFNREEVPEARTESLRKSNSQHPENWRLKELMLMLLLLQVVNRACHILMFS